MPQITIIIPTYNYASFIRETVDSALAQTFKDFEVIVVDDGSTDDTKRVLEPYIQAKKIQYIFQENQGLSAARNTGIRKSTSPFLTFLDADDLFTPNKLEVLYRAFTEHSEAGLVYGNHFQWTGRWLYKKPKFFQNTPPSGWIFSQLFQGAIMSVPSVMVKRECFNQVGLFNEDLTTTEDWEMWLRIAIRYRIIYVHKIVCYVRIHPKSMSTDFIKLGVNKLRVQKSIYAGHQDLLLSTYSQREIDGFFSVTYFDLAKYQLLRGTTKLSMKYLKIAVVLNRRLLVKLLWMIPLMYLHPVVRILYELKMRVITYFSVSRNSIKEV